jgi:hypothetical protein
MADPVNPSPGAKLPANQPAKPIGSSGECRVGAGDEKVLCERCGAEMFRMHAVWRCPQCRFKTDCCGW